MSELLSLIKAAQKPVIGMVQLAALPGSSRYTGGRIDGVLDRAIEEAEILVANGIDVLMVQNLGDLPVAAHATAAQVAWMTRAHRRYPLALRPSGGPQSPRERRRGDVRGGLGGRAPTSCGSRSMSAP